MYEDLNVEAVDDSLASLFLFTPILPLLPAVIQLLSRVFNEIKSPFNEDIIGCRCHRIKAEECPTFAN